MKLATQNVFIFIGVIIIAMAFAGSFSVVSTSKNFPITSTKEAAGEFSFAPNCEVIKINNPSIDQACAKGKFMDLRGSDNDKTVQLSYRDAKECVGTSVNINGMNIEMKPGQVIDRDGYILSFDDLTLVWVSGILDGSEDADVGASPQFGTIIASYVAEHSVTVDTDAITIAASDSSLSFSKKLPGCVPAGVAVSDSPRLLGATVIDHKDGTFSSVGNVEQMEIFFPFVQSGTVGYSPSAELGTHALVFKPFIEVGNKRVDVLPEALSVVSKSSSGVSIATGVDASLREANFIENVIAYFKKVFNIG